MREMILEMRSVVFKISLMNLWSLSAKENLLNYVTAERFCIEVDKMLAKLPVSYIMKSGSRVWRDERRKKRT